MATNFVQERDGSLVVKTEKRGIDVLSDPLLNKGTGFSADERRALNIEGLIPTAVYSIDAQVERALGNRDDIPIPISPVQPGVPSAPPPAANDRLTHTYPAASQPRRGG